jgi:hypothetical protein
MAVKLVIGLDDPDGVLAAAAYGATSVMQMQRSADDTFVAPTDVAEITILAATYYYAYWDAAGDRTSWYRWRLEKGDDTETGEWSDPFQGWDPAIPGRLSGSYAHPDEFLRRVPTKPTTAQTDRLARIDGALRDATGRLTDELGGLSFWRIPQTGATEVRAFDGDGSGVLHVHGGIVSLDAVRVKLSATSDFADVLDADWRLEYWADIGSPHDKPADAPYDHVVFTGAGTQRYWPRVRAGAELTGALGWPKAPGTARKAEIDLARQDLAADPSFAGGVVGPGGDLGRPVGPNLLPRSVYDLSLAMSRRFFCDL